MVTYRRVGVSHCGGRVAVDLLFLPDDPGAGAVLPRHRLQPVWLHGAGGTRRVPQRAIPVLQVHVHQARQVRVIDVARGGTRRVSQLAILVLQIHVHLARQVCVMDVVLLRISSLLSAVTQGWPCLAVSGGGVTLLLRNLAVV